MDGKSIIGLLDQGGGRIRESLALIQVWPHTEACQALSVVTYGGGKRPRRQNRQKQNRLNLEKRP